MLKNTLDAFEIHTVSHTQRPIIHKAMALLRGSIALFCNSSAHTDKEFDWEQHLPLTLYAYWTADHSPIGVSQHMLMFGREPQALLFDSSLTFDSGFN